MNDGEEENGRGDSVEEIEGSFHTEGVSHVDSKGAEQPSQEFNADADGIAEGDLFADDDDDDAVVSPGIEEYDGAARVQDFPSEGPQEFQSQDDQPKQQQAKEEIRVPRQPGLIVRKRETETSVLVTPEDVQNMPAGVIDLLTTALAPFEAWRAVSAQMCNSGNVERAITALETCLAPDLYLKLHVANHIGGLPLSTFTDSERQLSSATIKLSQRPDLFLLLDLIGLKALQFYIQVRISLQTRVFSEGLSKLLPKSLIAIADMVLKSLISDHLLSIKERLPLPVTLLGSCEKFEIQKPDASHKLEDASDTEAAEIWLSRHLCLSGIWFLLFSFTADRVKYLSHEGPLHAEVKESSQGFVNDMYGVLPIKDGAEARQAAKNMFQLARILKRRPQIKARDPIPSITPMLGLITMCMLEKNWSFARDAAETILSEVEDSMRRWSQLKRGSVPACLKRSSTELKAVASVCQAYAEMVMGHVSDAAHQTLEPCLTHLDLCHNQTSSTILNMGFVMSRSLFDDKDFEMSENCISGLSETCDIQYALILTASDDLFCAENYDQALALILGNFFPDSSSADLTWLAEYAKEPDVRLSQAKLAIFGMLGLGQPVEMIDKLIGEMHYQLGRFFQFVPGLFVDVANPIVIAQLFYRQVIAGNPVHAAARYNLAQCCASLGGFAEATELIEPLSRNPFFGKFACVKSFKAGIMLRKLEMSMSEEASNPSQNNVLATLKEVLRLVDDGEENVSTAVREIRARAFKLLIACGKLWHSASAAAAAEVPSPPYHRDIVREFVNECDRWILSDIQEHTGTVNGPPDACELISKHMRAVRKQLFQVFDGAGQGSSPQMIEPDAVATILVKEKSAFPSFLEYVSMKLSFLSVGNQDIRSVSNMLNASTSMLQFLSALPKVKAAISAEPKQATRNSPLTQICDILSFHQCQALLSLGCLNAASANLKRLTASSSSIFSASWSNAGDLKETLLSTGKLWHVSMLPYVLKGHIHLVRTDYGHAKLQFDAVVTSANRQLDAIVKLIKSKDSDAIALATNVCNLRFWSVFMAGIMHAIHCRRLMRCSESEVQIYIIKYLKSNGSRKEVTRNTVPAILFPPVLKGALNFELGTISFKKYLKKKQQSKRQTTGSGQRHITSSPVTLNDTFKFLITALKYNPSNWRASLFIADALVENDQNVARAAQAYEAFTRLFFKNTSLSGTDDPGLTATMDSLGIESSKSSTRVGINVASGGALAEPQDYNLARLVLARAGVLSMIESRSKEFRLLSKANPTEDRRRRAGQRKTLATSNLLSGAGNVALLAKIQRSIRLILTLNPLCPTIIESLIKAAADPEVVDMLTRIVEEQNVFGNVLSFNQRYLVGNLVRVGLLKRTEDPAKLRELYVLEDAIALADRLSANLRDLLFVKKFFKTPKCDAEEKKRNLRTLIRGVQLRCPDPVRERAMKSSATGSGDSLWMQHGGGEMGGGGATGSHSQSHQEIRSGLLPTDLAGIPDPYFMPSSVLFPAQEAPRVGNNVLVLVLPSVEDLTECLPKEDKLKKTLDDVALPLASKLKNVLPMVRDEAEKEAEARKQAASVEEEMRREVEMKRRLLEEKEEQDRRRREEAMEAALRTETEILQSMVSSNYQGDGAGGPGRRRGGGKGGDDSFIDDRRIVNEDESDPEYEKGHKRRRTRRRHRGEHLGSDDDRGLLPMGDEESDQVRRHESKRKHRHGEGDGGDKKRHKHHHRHRKRRSHRHHGEHEDMDEGEARRSDAQERESRDGGAESDNREEDHTGEQIEDNSDRPLLEDLDVE